jgi:hypothetical protein
LTSWNCYLSIAVAHLVDKDGTLPQEFNRLHRINRRPRTGSGENRRPIQLPPLYLSENLQNCRSIHNSGQAMSNHKPPNRLISFVSVAALASIAVFSQANAQRPDTRQMYCAQVASLVQERQSIVLTTGTHTYDRFVAYRSYCRGSQVAERAYAPTLDYPRCFIGYYCKERLFDR